MNLRNGATTQAPAETPPAAATAERILEEMPVAFFSVGRDFRLTYVNPVAERLMRRSGHELVGSDLWQEFPEALGTPFHSAAVRAMKEGVTLEFEAPYPSPLDSWFETRIYPSAEGLSVYFRDITERKRTEETLERKTAVAQLLQTIAFAANESPDVEKAVRACLDAVCGYLCWPVGHAYLVSDDEALVPMTVWHLNDPKRFQGFRQVTEAMRLGPEGGLPGRALAAGRPAWTRDMSEDPSLPRADAARRAGIRAGLAFPVFARSRVVAVLEVFSGEPADPDVQLQDVMGQIGTLVGRAIERHRAAERLRESTYRYRVLVESVRDMVLTVARDGTITSLNPAFERILGWSPVEWIGKSFEPMIHPDDRASTAGMVHEALRGGSPPVFETRAISTSGEYVPLEVTAEPGIVDGEVAYAIGIARDISERRLAEEELETARAKYRTLVENMPAISYVQSLEPDPATFYMSPQVEAVLGFDPEEFRDPTFWESRIHLEDRERVLAEDARTDATGEPFACEFRMIASDGRPVWVRDESVLVRSGEGQPLFWQGIIQDISVRKRVESELQRSFDLLRTANEDRRRLLARLVQAQEEERQRIASDIHDDTIQKMTAVGMRVETLHRRIDEPQALRAIEQLQEAVQLSIGGLRHLMFELRPPSLDREGLAAALRQHLSELAVEAGLKVHLENRLAGEPDPVTRIVAYRITKEALANVRRHASASAVDVVLETREGGLFVRIKDDGKGLSKAEEVDPRPGRFGLSSMRERAELAGGWWRIEGGSGAGTVVEFLLPPSAA